MSFYGPGDHFVSHNDQSEMGLVGIMLLGLHDTTNGSYEGKSTSILVHDKCHEEYCCNTHLALSEWRGALGNWCAFYSDADYEILPIGHGQLIMITFKVYSSININITNALPLPLLPSKNNSPQFAASAVEEDGKNGAKQAKKRKGKVVKEGKKSAQQLKRERITSLISSNIITSTYELADMSGSLSLIRDITCGIGRHDVTMKEKKADAMAKEKANSATKTSNKAKTKQNGGRGSSSNSKGGKSKGAAKDGLKKSDNDSNDVDDDDEETKTDASNEEEAKVNGVSKKLQFGLILKNAYSLFPGEIRAGNLANS
jgi:hypothetical protein